MIFRIDRAGDFKDQPFALMPYEAGTNDPHTCMLYARLGQHSSGDLHMCILTTRPATRKESAPLKRDLRRIGYDVQEIKRVCHSAAIAARRSQINRVA